jgi:hypothetical protein
MTPRHVTYADLDALLLGLGFTKRHVEVDHGRTEERSADSNGASSQPARSRFVVPGYAYEHEKSGALLLLPLFAPQDAADRHLVPTRHTLVDWGVISNDDWDRWLCQMRFPDVCDTPTVARSQAKQFGGATTSSPHRSARPRSAKP